MGSLLQVQDLHVIFQTGGGMVQAVRGVSFELQEGEVLAIVGESGSGKSVTAQAIVRLIPSPHGKISHGQILYQGSDLVQASEREMFKVRGAEIGMIFQDPMTSLNPTMTVGTQISEGIRWHRGLDATEAQKKAIEMLELVGIPNPQKRVHQYPHEFSGGMRQRVMIAMALASEPNILIADEPTTALDVTIQAQIMRLMKDLQQRTQTSIILITHDLGVVAETADRVAVMYGGRLVETGTVEEIFKDPHHPYTWGLLASMPRMDQSKDQELQPIPGSPPDLYEPPAGCPFADRCPLAMQVCLEEMPPVTSVSSHHQVACWLKDPEAPKVDREQMKHLFAQHK